jgi:tRNA-dihydrouridine synthase
MLRDVPRGHAILRAVRDRLPNATLSVSLRRAFDDSPDNKAALFELVDEAWRLGYAAVRVHGRTVEQKYLGRADWSILRELKQRYPNNNIVGSGDVFTAEDAVRMLRETGVNMVWIARGAIGNPWIFRDARKLVAERTEVGGLSLDGLMQSSLKPPTITEQRDALTEHFEIAMQIHGEQLAGRRMRKMGIKYARFHPLAAEVKKSFIEVRSLRDWQAVLTNFYSSGGEGVWPAQAAADEVNHDSAMQNCETG